MCDSLFIKKKVMPNRLCQAWMQLLETSELKCTCPSYTQYIQGLGKRKSAPFMDVGIFP